MNYDGGNNNAAKKDTRRTKEQYIQPQSYFALQRIIKLKHIFGDEYLPTKFLKFLKQRKKTVDGYFYSLHDMNTGFKKILI